MVYHIDFVHPETLNPEPLNPEPLNPRTMGSTDSQLLYVIAKM